MKSVANSELKQKGEELVSKIHIIISPLYLGLLYIYTCCCGGVLITGWDDLVRIIINERRISLF